MTSRDRSVSRSRKVIDLFEKGYREPPSEPVETSVLAAEEAKPTAGTQRSRLYRLLKRRGRYGATDDELEVLSGLSHHTVSPRRRELVLKGLVRDSGHRRPTRRGREAIVWELGVDLSPNEDGGSPMLQVPNKHEVKLALEDLRTMAVVTKAEGFRAKHPRELAMVGRWLRAIAGE